MAWRGVTSINNGSFPQFNNQPALLLPKNCTLGKNLTAGEGGVVKKFVEKCFIFLFQNEHLLVSFFRVSLHPAQVEY